MPSPHPARTARPINRNRLILALAVVVALLGAAAWWQRSRAAPPSAPLGLFTSLPILWSEAGDVAGMLAAQDAPHWARSGLAAAGPLRPLDLLTADSLQSVRKLVVIQPRPLSGPENVALDNWVRGGGQLLLFADPALTAESAFSLGDRRRPQDIVLLSPILRRWGLDLQFDEDQPGGERIAAVGNASVPVNLPGRFVLLQSGGACRSIADGLAATCRIGRGRIMAVADAALFEDGDEAFVEPRQAALEALLDEAFAKR